jgi:hypothetical protein
MRARLARLLRRRDAALPADAPAAGPGAAAPGDAAREARVAVAHARAWGARLAERARSECARTAIVAALLATEQAAARHEARAGLWRRSGGGPPLLH